VSGLRGVEAAGKVRIGAVRLDPRTGRVEAYRGQERFPLLSTFKVFAAAAVLHEARVRRPGLMDRVVTWTDRDLQAVSPVTKGRTGPGKGLTVAQLCAAAIQYSDNTAGNLLLRQIGGPKGLTSYLRSLGDQVSRLDRWEPTLNDWSPGDPRDTTTPAAAAADLSKITVGDALVPPDRSRLVGWLRSSTTGTQRIRAGLPGWTVGDKTGTGHDAANDLAVAWQPGKGDPIVLAIYTTREKAAVSDKVLADTATALST